MDATLLRLITSLLGWIAAKAAFLRKSQSHGRKDLTFVRSFKVSQGDRHERQDTIWEGFANRSTILPMINLDGNVMKKGDANMNGAEFIKHVELEINYTDTKVEHPLPLMCKWFSKFHKGNNKSDVPYIDEKLVRRLFWQSDVNGLSGTNSHRQYDVRVKRLGREHQV